MRPSKHVFLIPDRYGLMRGPQVLHAQLQCCPAPLLSRKLAGNDYVFGLKSFTLTDQLYLADHEPCVT